MEFIMGQVTEQNSRREAAVEPEGGQAQLKL